MGRRKPECSNCGYLLSGVVRDVTVEVRCPECGIVALPVPPLMVFGPELNKLFPRMCTSPWILGALCGLCTIVAYLFSGNYPKKVSLAAIAAYWLSMALWVLVAATGLLLPMVMVFRMSRRPRFERAPGTLIIWLFIGIWFNAIALAMTSGVAMLTSLFVRGV